MLPILETSLAHNTKETRMNLKGALIEFASGKSMHLDEELWMRENVFLIECNCSLISKCSNIL